MAATIHDVAREAGVSASTVSRVLNGSAPVNEEKRRRVLRAVEKLNYRPNALARSLKKKRTHSIGLIVPDITNPFFAEVAKGVEDVAREYGYTVILCNSENDPARERTYLNVLQEKQVDGVIFVTAGANEGDRVGRLERGIPVVMLDREIPGIPADAVLVDNEEGAYEAAKHLLALGHRRIGIITGPLLLSTAEERLEGYKKAMREAGVPVKPRLVKDGGFTFQGGYAAMHQLLEGGNDLPSAVLASSDIMALGAMKAAEERGLRIPQDLALVGFDDIMVASLVKPALTTIAQPKRQMGQLAVEMIVERLERGRRRAKRVLLRPKLVVRESCGSGRRSDGA
jgi:LacI family transcriptional regulator